MAIDLVTKFQPYTDEMFKAESKKYLLTNQDFDWTGAHTVKVYKITTSDMNDYGRTGPEEGNWSRYGAVDTLDATTEEMTLTKDRSFTFAIDKLDEDETAEQLAAASALARQIREKVIPEVDTYTYGVMCTKAGNKPTAATLTADNIYDEILKGSEALDNAEAPETNRVLLVTPASYSLMKKSADIVLETDVGQEMRLRGDWYVGRPQCYQSTGKQTALCFRLPAGPSFCHCRADKAGGIQRTYQSSRDQRQSSRRPCVL